MAEGAASREGPLPPDAAGGEDDPRVGSAGASGDGLAAALGSRSRDRRSGVVLPVAAGSPADSEAGLLEAARATPRRSSIIKVKPDRGRRGVGVGGGRVRGPGRTRGAPRRRRLGVVFSHLPHRQTFLPGPEVPRLSPWK